MSHCYKVLVVDDSSFMRQYISDFLEQDNTLQVVGTAKDGWDALIKTKFLKPDVITMDVEMPVMDGLTALKEIMNKYPTPVVMISSYTREGAEATFKALECGAVDFIAKTSGTVSMDLNIIEEQIIEKVKAAASVSLKGFQPFGNLKKIVKKPLHIKSTNLRKIVAIGTSTGGPRALHSVIAGLPADLAAGILIVQHMPPGFTKSLADRLNRISQVTVKEAEHGDELLPGMALLAPGDYHMTLQYINDRFLVQLDQGNPIKGHRPSVDMMMNSVAHSGLHSVGVLLTGMGDDGAIGMESIKENHGQTIAEDASTSVIFGMPKAAIDKNVVDYVVPLPQVAAKIIALIN